MDLRVILTSPKFICLPCSRTRALGLQLLHTEPNIATRQGRYFDIVATPIYSEETNCHRSSTLQQPQQNNLNKPNGGGGFPYVVLEAHRGGWHVWAIEGGSERRTSYAVVVEVRVNYLVLLVDNSLHFNEGLLNVVNTQRDQLSCVVRLEKRGVHSSRQRVFYGAKGDNRYERVDGLETPTRKKAILW